MDAASSLADPTPQISERRFRFAALPRALGVFLIATAWMKVLAPAEAANIQTAYDIPYWLVAIGIQAEFVVGTLLLGL